MANPDLDSSAAGSPRDDEAFERWLVRILLALAFGLAFGIEGMTLVRSFLLDTEDPDTEQTADDVRPTLEEGDALVPSVAPNVRVRRLRLWAEQEEWTFTLTVGPDSLDDRAYTVTFDRLTLDNGAERTSDSTYTWAPSDTSSFDASWTLPVGRRPDALTVTATAEFSADSTASETQTVGMSHVPVRQQ